MLRNILARSTDTFPSNFMRRLPPLFFLTLALAAGPAAARGPARADTTLAAPLPPPAAAAAVRQPATGRLAELRRQHDFQYVDVRQGPTQPSLWQRLLAWLWRLLAGSRDTQGGRTTGDILFYGLVVAALVYGVLKFLQVDLTRMFGRAPRGLPLGYEEGQENIHELDFDQTIAQAEAAGNRRLALRLGYLQLLKQLTDRDFIAWQPDKTNHDYLRELAARYPAARPAFAELTRQFEYVWYGELPLTAAGYRTAREAQQQLARQLREARPLAA